MNLRYFPLPNLKNFSFFVDVNSNSIDESDRFKGLLEDYGAKTVKFKLKNKIKIKIKLNFSLIFSFFLT